jgi:hypothetical protein
MQHFPLVTADSFFRQYDDVDRAFGIMWKIVGLILQTLRPVDRGYGKLRRSGKLVAQLLEAAQLGGGLF